MPPAPFVSVIVPVHQVAPYVGAAIASLRAQTLTDFEALVIDDGSTDGSGARAQQAAAGDARFHLIRQANAGLSAARNAGLERARGQWLAFLDGDDAFEPGFLSALIAGAEGAGLPWAASALWLDEGGGVAVPHSALHGTPDPAGMAPRALDLGTAPQAARLFPSAWNKVYRRDVWGALRFRPGTWYEDHEVYWDWVARAPTIWHLPRPLYRHRRQRPGQITGADDERVFDLFGVLDRVAPRVLALPQGGAGLTALAARLIDERARVLRQPARRARFLAVARDWLAGAGLTYDPAAAGPDVSRALGMTLSGRRALSVLAPDPTGSAEPLPDAQPVPLPAPAPRLPQALAQAEGAFVLLAPPGEVPLADGIDALLTAALDRGADLALGGLLTPQGWHDGWMDNRVAPPAGQPAPLSAMAALRLHPAASRAVVRSDLAARIGDLSVPPDHPLAGAEWVLRAALAARAVAVVPVAAARLGAPQPVPRAAALGWARGLPDLHPDLPQGWRGLLALRALRPQLPPARSAQGLAARLGLAGALWRAGLRPGPDLPPDPGTDRILRSLLRHR